MHHPPGVQSRRQGVEDATRWRRCWGIIFFLLDRRLAVDGLHVARHPALRHEPLATEVAEVTLDSEVLFDHSMLIHSAMFHQILAALVSQLFSGHRLKNNYRENIRSSFIILQGKVVYMKYIKSRIFWSRLMYRASHLVKYLVDLDFDFFAVCQILPWLVGSW